MYYLSYEEASVKKIEYKLCWHNDAIVDWRSYIREICSLWLMDDVVVFGGPGHIAKIDEYFVFRRKYNVGRIPTQKLVLLVLISRPKMFF